MTFGKASERKFPLRILQRISLNVNNLQNNVMMLVHHAIRALHLSSSDNETARCPLWKGKLAEKGNAVEEKAARQRMRIERVPGSLEDVSRPEMTEGDRG